MDVSRQRAALVAARAAIDVALAELDCAEVAASNPISIKQAAREAGKSVRTMKRWCAAYAIGRKEAGRWIVFPERLLTLRNTE